MKYFNMPHQNEQPTQTIPHKPPTPLLKNLTSSSRTTITKLLFPLIALSGCSSEGELIQHNTADAGNTHPDSSHQTDSSTKDTINESIPPQDTSLAETNDTNEPQDSHWEEPVLTDSNNCSLYDPGLHNSPTSITFSAVDKNFTQTSTISGVFSPVSGEETSNSWTSNNASFELSSSDNTKYPLIFTMGGYNAIQVELNNGTSAIFKIDKIVLANILSSITCNPNEAACIETQQMLDNPDYTTAPYALTLWTLSHTANMAKCFYNFPNGTNCHIYQTQDPSEIDNLFIPISFSGSFSEEFPSQTQIYLGVNGCAP